MINPELEAIGIHLMDMDTAVHEQVVENDDGSFSIFINSRLNYEQQMTAYYHAILHIANDDFKNHGNVDLIEVSAHT